jgi:hypothetical protein
MPVERPREHGQVLPLFALFLVVLLAFAALAIDVSGAYSARRFYRSVADGASLAGAQDLQQAGSRAVGAADRIRARQDAMKHLTTELAIAGGVPGLPAPCATSTDADVTDACVLTGTAFHASIKAGVYAGQPVAIACVECDPARSVQVGLRNANYHLSFASVLGQSNWSVGISSVAGLQWSKSYAVVTLRPRASLGQTNFDVKDIKLDGGTHVTVSNGDVASNANMDYTGLNTSLLVDSGFGMYYADPGPPVAPTWSGAPTGTHISTYVPDPNYTYPAMSGTRGLVACGLGPLCAPTFTDASTSACGAPGPTVPCTTPALDPLGCGAEVTYLQTSVYAFMATQPLTRIYCYKPGIYDPSSNPKQLTVASTDVGILMPGAYYFKSPNGGLDVSGRLIGGYRQSSEGVALMFDECGSGSSHCIFTGNNALTIALNVGTKYPPGASGTSANAAHDWNDQAVQTSGPSSPTPAILMTLLVKKDSANCFVTTYPASEPNSCNDSNNKTLNLAGGGSLDIEGVQYAPTDNVEIHGGSSGTGQVGQIWAWTLFYSGGTQINQQGAGSTGPGVLRLDAACTAPGTPCNP